MTEEKGCGDTDDKGCGEPEEKVLTTGSNGVHHPTYGEQRRITNEEYFMNLQKEYKEKK